MRDGHSEESNGRPAPDAGGADVAELFEVHLPGLRRFLQARAAAHVLAREDADDLAQSVCRDVLEHLDDGRMELRSGPEFKQWLYEAALLKLKARVRYHGALRREPGREVRPEGGAPGETAAVSETPSRLARTAEDRARVQRAIDELGGRDAEILRLAVLEERPHGEIAGLLGVTTSHSRVLLSRALAKLSRFLGPDGGTSRTP